MFHGPDTSPPILTAALVAGSQRARVARCLRHLLGQTALSQMEIVAVDISPGGEYVEGRNHAGVRWLHRPDLSTMGAARAECVRAARGAFVAFVEDHSYADPRWAEGVIRAFEQAHDVDLVTYAMANANPERLLCRVFMMVEYGRWHDPAVSGFISISASNNVAYRRSALLPYLPRLDDFLEAEYVLHQEMQRQGSRVWLAADAKVSHENWTRLGDGLHANCVIKRLLAAVRATQGKWPLPKRIAWAAAMPLTVPLHIARLAWSLVPRPRLWLLFWQSVPLMVLVYGASALSEAMGYLTGPAGASARFRDLEISIPRDH